MSSLRTGKPELNRFINRRLILDKIRRDGEISRADLAKQIAIRPPTVSAVVKDLIQEGLVHEVGLGATTCGRAPRMIALDRSQPRALGFEMSERSILAGLCNLTGDLCAQLQSPFSPLAPDLAVDELYRIGSELISSAGIDWKYLQGVGVAVPGYMSGAQGHIRWSRAFGWHDVPFKQLCEERWGVDTDVVNDSQAGSMAAQQFNTEEPVDHLVFLFVRFDDVLCNEVGLGVGIIINGEPFHGQFGAAGEMRTPVVHPLVHAKNLDGQAIAGNISNFTKVLQEGHPVAQQAILRVAEELSNVVLNIVNLIEPGILMIDSEEPVLRDILLEYLRKFLEENPLAYEPGQTQLIASTLGKYGVARGAIVPTLQRIFRIPQWL